LLLPHDGSAASELGQLQPRRARSVPVLVGDPTGPRRPRDERLVRRPARAQGPVRDRPGAEPGSGRLSPAPGPAPAPATPPAASLCSSATPPPPGVPGMDGWLAARRAPKPRSGIDLAPSLAPGDCVRLRGPRPLLRLRPPRH